MYTIDDGRASPPYPDSLQGRDAFSAPAGDSRGAARPDDTGLGERYNQRALCGAVAQLGEHHVRNVGVEGSSPFCSTIPSLSLSNGGAEGLGRRCIA